MDPQEPSVGRIVHYVPVYDQAGAAVAALISGVNKDGSVNLHVFYNTPSSAVFRENIKYSEENEKNTWHWPIRV